MTSFEPRRTSAYGDDLRWRMVWQKEALKYSYEEVGSNLGVDRSTVVRVVEFFRTTGNVSKRQYPKERAARELTAPVQLFILNLVVQRPGIYLQEVQKELEDFLMMNIAVSTICRFVLKWIHSPTTTYCCIAARYMYVLEGAVHSRCIRVLCRHVSLHR